MTSYRRAVLALLMLLMALTLDIPHTAQFVGAQEAAEEEPAQPLYQQAPFDLMAANNGTVHRIVPLDLPVRKVVPQTSGALRVRLLSEPEDEVEIQWSNIEKVTLFEELLLAEAEKLTAKKDFDEAFRHYLLLLDAYPQTERLGSSFQNYLFLNAGLLASQGRYAEALSALEELFERNPEYVGAGERSVASALSQVAGIVMRQYIEAEEYGNARKILKRLDTQYGASRLPSLNDARNAMVSKAEAKAQQVRQLVEQDKLLEAQIASREMLRIWPDLEGGLDLAREVARMYPIVSVGVSQRAQQFDTSSLTDWAARRAGRLQGRLLVEYVGPGPEGGRYATPMGAVIRGDDFMSLTFEVEADPHGPSDQGTAYDIGDRLLAMANPSDAAYLPGWADIMQSVRVDGAQRLDVLLRRPYVVPEAFLRMPLGTGSELPPWVNSLRHYELAERDDAQTRYLRINSDTEPKERTGPAEIRERYFEDATEAIRALQKGEILLLDRLFPGDAAKLSANDGDEVIVRSYGAPTLHMLVPNISNPYLKTSTFRRALVHAIPRQLILNRMLEDRPLPGCRVITGPIPPGTSASDPVGYAYDETLAVHPFEPGVAMILTGMAKEQLRKLADKKEEPAPELGTLVIAHPEDAIAKFACAIIAAQLQNMNIACELKQLPAGQVDDPERKYDLLYVAISMQEPVVDVQKLLGGQGIVKTDSAYISLALRQVQKATTWREARERLHQLHQLVYSEMTVIPLWQITEHYAHHTSVQGLKDQIGTLYQDVETWQIEPVVEAE